MKVEVAAVTAISVLSARFIADLAFGLSFRIMCLFIKENERMDWVQGMVQPKGYFRT